MARLTGTGFLLTLLFTWLFLHESPVRGQGFGGFGGAGSSGAGSDVGPAAMLQLPLLPPENALNVITIDGTAELRVVPEGIRVVLAITNAGKTAEECQQKNAAQVQAVWKAWADLKIGKEQVVEDFINILPVYEWRLTERDGQEFRVQQQEGYRMQTNLHVSVQTEASAMEAINLALKQGAAEIVTFDYWSSDLNEQRVKARAAAMDAAREKAKTLLAVFAEEPKVINVQENTAVFLPHSLYRTYENVLQEETEYGGSWRDKPAIKSPRPRMTFFEGLQSRSDTSPSTPAMKPEIAVVSTVRLYYQSPADKKLSDK